MKTNTVVDLGALRRMNWPLLALLLVLCGVGCVFIRSASTAGAGPEAGLMRKQVMWIVVGLAGYVALTIVDYRRLCREAWLLYGAGLVLLVCVLLFGKVIYGARRWLELGGVRFQPSELMKLGTILLLAKLLSGPEVTRREPWALALVLAAAAVPALLILMQPDLGTAMVLGPIAFCMMVAARAPSRVLLTLAGIGVVGVGLVLAVIFVPEQLGWSPEAQRRALRVIGLSEYQEQRIKVFVKPNTDPLGAGWTRKQSAIAVGAGGRFGKGLGNGTQNTLGFLPWTVTPTDFIFSVIAEESGFLGACTVLLLFLGVVLSGMKAAMSAPEKTGRLICVGVVTMLFTHVFVNIGMTIGVMPVTGLPLPLISYGGSFMLTMMAAFGLLQSVYARRRVRT